MADYATVEELNEAIGVILDNPVYNPKGINEDTIVANYDAWDCNDWIMWLFALVKKHGDSPLFVRSWFETAWNDPRNYTYWSFNGCFFVCDFAYIVQELGLDLDGFNPSHYVNSVCEGVETISDIIDETTTGVNNAFNVLYLAAIGIGGYFIYKKLK